MPWSRFKPRRSTDGVEVDSAPYSSPSFSMFVKSDVEKSSKLLYSTPSLNSIATLTTEGYNARLITTRSKIATIHHSDQTSLNSPGEFMSSDPSTNVNKSCENQRPWR
jgi:hypothetical protein